MNNKRRKEIQEAITELEELKSIVESIRDEEQEIVDNMPENLQSSERYEIAEAAAENLDNACTSLDEALDYLIGASE